MNEKKNKQKKPLWSSVINHDARSAPATLSGTSFTRRMPSLIAGRTRVAAVMRRRGINQRGENESGKHLEIRRD